MESLTVKIKQGQLRGCLRTDIDGGKIFSFLGIPYAKPPVSDLRFKAPLPAESWNGIRDATKEGDICYSIDMITGTIEGSEDCLNLNVFTRELPQSGHKLKPVMVWIHGGAFVMGSNRVAYYGPEFLLTEDIVLVLINYRLGTLGFLSLEDPTLGIPGNAGLKDQTLALKWVQENIKEFGGDPDNVTIFGESAGGASVHFHILSPSSKGLFHKAILQSGCTLNHWAWGGHAAEKLAKALGKDTVNEEEALEVLKRTRVDNLYVAQEKLRVNEFIKASSMPNFGPVIEKPNETAFLTRSPIDIITSGDYNKVPIIIGYTNMEGLLIEAIRLILAATGQTVTSEESPSTEDAIPWQVGLEKGSENSQLVGKKLTDMYFKNTNFVENKCVLATDSSFASGIIGSAINHAKTSQNPVYLYRVSLDAGLNFFKSLVQLQHLPGTCHADELGYLFKTVITPEIKPGTLEETSIRRFVKLWTNFAKYGNPTPNENELGVVWKPVTQENINFLDIGKKLIADSNPESERMALWKKIYQLNPETAKYL